MEEVEAVVKALPGDKAGPDGFPAVFYKTYWDVIKTDVYRAICQFASTGNLLVQWKSCFIALVPKVPNAQSPDEYHPISLCNVAYKIVSKLLTNRLKLLLSKNISLEQGAFVPGRNINEAILLMQEVLLSMAASRNAAKAMLVKLDLNKAYEMLRWDFL